MTLMDAALLGLTLVGVMLLALLVWRPRLANELGGKVLAFLVLFVLPMLVTSLGTQSHLEHAKSTSFCLSCHEMEPYGRSLSISDPDYLPAGHFQNNLVPRDQACYTCHTTYTMYGDLNAKWQGLKHVYVHYLGTIPDPIELYAPYSNRECLHCHGGARSFEEFEDHAELRQQLATGQASCLECHDYVHDVHRLEEIEMWQGPSR